MILSESILTPDALAFLEEYLNTPSPTGYEWRGQQIWLDYIKPFVDTYDSDNYGTVYGVINSESDYRVVIEAHADEISWCISYIAEDGMISVIRNGGMDHQIAPSKRVNIHTRDGRTVKGIFGWPAIHVRKESDNGVKAESLFIDCGYNKQELTDLGVFVGCVVTYQDGFDTLGPNYFMGRALDNRIGGFMIAQVARLLRENNIQLPFALYIVNAVQEEVGSNGAKMISRTINPDIALVTDVTHDTGTPMMNKAKLGDYVCGKGPTLSFAPPVHNKFLDLLIETAQAHDIPFQREANSVVTGTDTDAFAYATHGIVSALISLPLRYMHTTVETVHRNDIVSIVQLMYYALQRIEYKHNFKFIK